MKIGLLGYGKMGKVIEKIANKRGHDVVLAVNEEPSINDLKSVDVAIEFSIPSAACNNIRKCFSVNVPIVVGTTGWYNDFDEMVSQCKLKNQALFYATNYSVGVNIFWELNKKLAKLMNQQEDYEVSLREIHHLQKLDAPSGTAITTAEQIISAIDRKDTWGEGNDGVNNIVIHAEREGEVPGTHVVSYESDIDKLEISHEAKGREGFATGAVVAAEWILGKKGVFTMKDMLKF